MVGRELRLFDGEKIAMVLTPHPMAFYGMHLLWVYVILVSSVFYVISDSMIDYFESPMQSFSLAFFGKADSPLISKTPILNVFATFLDSILGGTITFSIRYGLVFLWFILLFVPSVGVSIMRISWKWMAYIILTGVLSVLITVISGSNEKMVYVIASVFAVFGMICVDLYRRGHHYIITNHRLITDVRFIYNVRDDINYDKINNLVMNQSLIGRVFNFGTVMPLTASGLGMGSDYAAVSVGAGKAFSSGVIVGGALTGGRSVNFPRDMAQFSLIGIRHPRQVIDLISEYVHLDDEAPYLKSMASDMKELLGEVKKDKGKVGERDEGA